MNLTALEMIALVLVGLVAGGLGGLLGIGGSIIMIPAMAVLFHKTAWGSQHLFQAAAMVVNVFVSAPAALRHKRAGAIHTRAFLIVMPVTLVAIIAGVLVSNQMRGPVLQVVYAAFIVYVVVAMLLRAARKARDNRPEEARPTFARCSTVGLVMGFLAGLLGIGGGILAVPLLNSLCRLPLRNCIAVSAATMMLTAGVGALLKVSTLPMHDRSPSEAVVLALVLAPTAVLGGYLGAGLTHRLPLNAIRIIFAAVLLAAAARMAGLF